MDLNEIIAMNNDIKHTMTIVFIKMRVRFLSCNKCNACMMRKESLSLEDCHRSYTSLLVHDKNETCNICFTFQSSHSLVPCSVLHQFDSISKHTSHSLYGQEF